jgi:methyl-accepting chemotaxis protein
MRVFLEAKLATKFLVVVLLGAVGLVVFGAVTLGTLSGVVRDERQAVTKQEAETASSLVKSIMEDAKKTGRSTEEAQKTALAALSAMRYSNNQYFWVNDLAGQMLMHPLNSKLVGTSMMELKDPYGSYIFRDIIDVVKKNGSGYYHYWWQLPGEAAPREKVSFVIGVPEWNWVIGTGVYLDDVRESALALAERLVAVGVGVLAVIALLSQLVARTVVRPLRAVVGQMNEVAEGRLDIEVTGAGRRDEVGDVARALDVFKNSAREVGRLRREQEESQVTAAAERKREMARLADALEASVADEMRSLSAAASELETTARGMAEASKEANLQVGAVSAASVQASGSVETVAASAEELSASISEITRQVGTAAQTSRSASERTGKANEMVHELAAAAQKIGDVVKLINAIAHQTNLLALNATIEAARAGEAGKGFAVVAGEVKNLANQTSKATGEIGQHISRIQEETTRAVEAICGIGGAIGEVEQVSAAIATAVEQQGAATEEIARSSQQAAQGTQEMTSNIGGVARTAELAGAAAERVLGMAQSLSGTAARLRGDINGFLAKVRAG